MNRPSGSRQTDNFSEAIHQQLNTYAVAAIAAGVGMIAFAKQSDAKIVYTPVYKVIKPFEPYDLDLNQDGNTDFTIKNAKGTTQFLIALTEVAPPGNSVVGFKTIVGESSSGIWCASALKGGAGIGPRRKFTNGTSGRALLFYSGFYGRHCPWNAANRYLGLRFQIQDKAHYGWARLSVLRVQEGFKVILTGYAYEDISGKRIIAGKTKGRDEIESTRNLSDPASATVPTPKPGTLGALALGAPGLSIWRREELISARQ